MSRWVVYGFIAVLVIALAELDGYRRGERKLFEYQADQAKEGARIVVKQGKVTERVITKYVKVAGDTKVVTNTVEKEVVRYANTGNCLDAAWGRLHDAAALNTIPSPSGGSDAASRAPAASEALQAVTASYAACHRTADRLDALQEWVRGQVSAR